MAAGDLIDFDIIEGQKENIQSLPGGRSAKKLAEVFSPSPLHKLATPTPTDSKNINDCIRAEYEAEVANLSESDDPLDIFDRYVRWTFDAYPSAQATPQSQLHTLLERATKAFIGSAQYKNDPRYLKLWLHYIRFFSDSPRETYVFLSRHSIGEGLALFYEEYAAWLESADRWAQAEEVYKLGIQREARPVQRLVRKFGEFEQRRAQQPDAGPSSPALPTVRPALAAKIDPFGAAARAATDPQAPRPTAGVGGQSSKPGKAKLSVFSDASSEASAMSKMGEGARGWDTIGSLGDRKKENVMEAKPWVGETLTTQVKKSSGPKMSVFRDTSLSRIAESHIVIAPSKHQVIVNPQSGKRERVFVNLEAIYPTPEEPGTELSFEELWAASRGWLDVFWEDESLIEEELADEHSSEVDLLGKKVAEKLVIHHDMVELDENGAVKEHARPAKSKKKKVMEVNETQIIKAKLDSPSGPKIKKKSMANSEPTMTMHTKAATNDIYDIFNAAPAKPASVHEEVEESDDDYTTDGDYTSGAESANTTRRVSLSEAGEDDETSDVKSVSEWSDFTAHKHIPKVDGESDNEQDEEGNDSDVSDLIDTKDPEDDGDTKESPRTRFVPIPPEDYQAPTRPYRDPAEVANSRLPFMTPITERTESSLALATEAKPSFASANTLSKRSSLYAPIEEDEYDDEDYEPPSSPLQEVFSSPRIPSKIFQPRAKKIKVCAAPSDELLVAKEEQKGPVIKETQCNPLDASIRDEILERMLPPITSYSGFYDHRNERSERSTEIRKFIKAVTKAAGKKENDKTSTLQSPVVLEFPELMGEYTLKKELGAGAFAPVYLVENSSPEDAEDDESAPVIAMGKGAFATTTRASQEALKMEDPPTAWEFYMMRLAAARLGPQHRATASISAAHELHLYQDECFLFLPYHPHGTLLDVVNFFSETTKAPMEEPLVMFFSIELLRTVEALHSKQILHGDLKPDNCLLRIDDMPTSAGGSLSSQWRADGSGGWSARGVTLIDFGRGIDMRAFGPDVQFVAEWKTDTHDCAEAREGRPWTWQLDYHGLANNIHTMLFGKYIDVVRDTSGAPGALGTSASRRYCIRESYKRYHETAIWKQCFDVLLNPAGHVDAEDNRRLPVTRSLRRVRETMEDWLEKHCEKGTGLKTLMARVESMAKSRKS
ncbi:Mad3/BUB1 homology region 1-domain-containing protein [Hypoxylon sp. FL1150]|nr:Mad3/BUB1 homology region 1-domain-containing protein [Hypoxylon sp. FL1150]